MTPGRKATEASGQWLQQKQQNFQLWLRFCMKPVLASVMAAASCHYGTRDLQRLVIGVGLGALHVSRKREVTSCRT